MAVHAFGNGPAIGTGSGWGGCTGGDHHIVAHSDLLNNQVRKVCNYGHRLTLVWERVLSEGSVLSLSIPHVSSSRMRKNQDMLHRVVFFLKIRYAFLRFMVKLYLVDRHPLCTHHRCRIMLVGQSSMDHSVKSLTDRPRSLVAMLSY